MPIYNYLSIYIYIKTIKYFIIFQTHEKTRDLCHLILRFVNKRTVLFRKIICLAMYKIYFFNKMRLFLSQYEAHLPLCLIICSRVFKRNIRIIYCHAHGKIIRTNNIDFLDILYDKKKFLIIYSYSKSKSLLVLCKNISWILNLSKNWHTNASTVSCLFFNFNLKASSKFYVL